MRVTHVQRVADIVAGNGKLDVAISSILNGLELNRIGKFDGVVSVNDGIENGATVSSE